MAQPRAHKRCLPVACECWMVGELETAGPIKYRTKDLFEWMVIDLAHNLIRDSFDGMSSLRPFSNLFKNA
jgi:hypothetical protein